MSAPVTEIVDLPLLPNITEETLSPVLTEACRTLRARPGCHAARFSRRHEDAGVLTMLIDWDAVSSHTQFTADEAVYGPFYAAVRALCAADPTYYHAALDPTPAGVLDVAPATEVLHLYFPAEYGLEREQAALATVREFGALTQKAAGPEEEGGGGSGLMVGSPALGWVVEPREFKGQPARVLVAMLGWQGVDAHMTYRETDTFKDTIGMLRGLDGLLGVTVYHVACAKGQA